MQTSADFQGLSCKSSLLFQHQNVHRPAPHSRPFRLLRRPLRLLRRPLRLLRRPLRFLRRPLRLLRWLLGNVPRPGTFLRGRFFLLTQCFYLLTQCLFPQTHWLCAKVQVRMQDRCRENGCPASLTSWKSALVCKKCWKCRTLAVYTNVRSGFIYLQFFPVFLGCYKDFTYLCRN